MYDNITMFVMTKWGEKGKTGGILVNIFSYNARCIQFFHVILIEVSLYVEHFFLLESMGAYVVSCFWSMMAAFSC